MAIKIKEKKKIALVLGGGGVKAAAFHVGVCLALKEKGFKFAGGTKEEVERNHPDENHMTIRVYVGSSAGAFVSTVLAAGYSIEAMINAFEVGAGHKPYYSEHGLQTLKPISYRNFFGLNGFNLFSALPLTLFKRSVINGGFEAILKNLIKINGLFTSKSLEKYLSHYVLSHNDFQKLGVELFIIGTQLNHSRKVIFGNFPKSHKNLTTKFVNYATISQAVAASVSIPPVFAPYGIKAPSGKMIYYMDGEIRDTLSTHVATDHGADLIISSYSLQPYHYTEEIGSLHNFGIPLILNQALYQVIQQKIDRHIRHQSDIRAIYNAIDGYFKQMDLPDDHREKILEIIRNRVHYKPKVDYVYIHPRPQDTEMFFADHFSLNSQKLNKIVRIGFKSAINHLRQFDL